MRTLPLLALTAILIGCGGAGGDTSFIEGTAGTVSLTFAGGTGYNGRTDAFSAYTSLDGSAAKGVVTIDATNNDRGVEVSYIASSAKTGDVVDLASGAGGSTVIYTDTVNNAVNRWTSTSGTITVTSRTTTAVQITLTNVVVTNQSGTSAAGTVTLNGTMSFVAR